jgi:hypothetical protein
MCKKNKIDDIKNFRNFLVLRVYNLIVWLTQAIKDPLPKIDGKCHRVSNTRNAIFMWIGG